ncbi:hypothetical protein AAHC03_09131 [Spirometra sp. Aus1]
MLEITRAPLKPQQRLTLLKRHCVPKLLHQLVLGAVHRYTLKRLDAQVRQAVRKWLKLPADTSISFLHAAIRDGGFGVPCLTALVSLAKRRRLDTKEPAVRVAAAVPSAFPGMRIAVQPVRMGQSVLASKKDARNYWRTSLYASADGRLLAHFADSAGANHWLSSPDRVFPWLFLRGIHLRTGILSTKSCKSRRTGSEGVLCRGQCGQPTSRTLDEMIDLLIEPHVPEGNSYCKPDIVMSTENSITVTDVAVAGEDLMDPVYAGKDRRYSAGEVKVNLRRILTKLANTTVSHVPAVFSTRGTLSSRSESLLRSLGLSKFDLSDLCLAVVPGSLKAYDVYVLELAVMVLPDAQGPAVLNEVGVQNHFDGPSSLAGSQ